jgi:hypothetical protein
MLKEICKEIKQRDQQFSIRTFTETYICPLEDDIHDLLEFGRMRLNKLFHLLNALYVFIEVLSISPHLVVELQAKYGYTVILEPVDMIPLDLILRPFVALICQLSLRFVLRSD